MALSVPTTISAISLDAHLRSAGVCDSLRHLIAYVGIACKHIVREVWCGRAGRTGAHNVYQEEQYELDVLSNRILEEHMRLNELVACYASEECEQIVQLRKDAPYSLVFDPLDGSSLIDVNFAIGTIAGVYHGPEILGRRPREQAAAMYILYGPRTTLTYSVGAGKGVHEFVLDDIGEFVYHKSCHVEPDAKAYAPGNISAAASSPGYKRLVDLWIHEQKTLRYSGCMVPDIHHILSKGNGIFCNLSGGKFPEGKLRLPFECGPFAFLVEEAGGASSDGQRSILDKSIDRIEQRTQFIVGSKNEVDRVTTILREG